MTPTESRPRLFLVDGYALVYRAFHAVGDRPLTTSKGENTAIAWGIANFIDRLRRTHAPDYLGWVHDAGTSDRDRIYPGYKATRIALEPGQKADFDRGVERVEQILAAHHVPLLVVPGYEADDVIATLALESVAAGVDAVVVSPDKDLLQLIQPGIVVLNPYHGRPGVTTEKWYDASNAAERLGVQPALVVDYLALVGDSSDNIPGVRGIGDKGARKLLEQWGSLENILAHVDEVTPPRARSALQAHAGDARLSRDLVTARLDVPVSLELASLAISEPDTESLRSLYMELEFATLARALGGSADTRKQAPPARYSVVNTISALDALVAQLRENGRFVLSVQTEPAGDGPAAATPMRSRLVGLALCASAGEAWYLPFGHRSIGGQNELQLGAAPAPAVLNLPPLADPRMRPLVDLLEDRAVAKVQHNAKPELLVLRRAGLSLAGTEFDTMLASYVLDPGRRSHDLDQLALEMLGTALTERTAVFGKGKREIPVAEATVDIACAYSCERADVTAQLQTALEPRLAEHELTPLLHDIELPLVRVLADMEQAGVAIDLAWFASLKARFQAARELVEKKIWAEAGEEFNINSNAQLRDVLFSRLRLPIRKRTATGPSTDASVLQELADEGHALPGLLMEYRELAKLESTYLDALPALVNPDTGRLHTSYLQTVAATGRLSSTDPNLQNIPIRTEVGRDIRRGFIPRSGWLFMAADYSQIELRLLAHLSQDPAFVEAFRAGGDIHRETAAAIFGVATDAVTAEMRSSAKTINFATIYGQGAYSLSRQLKIDTEEARAFIATYFERFAGVRRFLDDCVQTARDRGYVETLFRRRRYVPELRDRNFNIRAFGERVAQNSPIQGSAADLIKIAMLRADTALRRAGLESRMLLQVHDELVFEAAPSEVDALRQLVTDAMENAATLSVPLVVDIGVGPNWLETKV